MAAHRYWRVNFATTQTPGANPVDLQELILRSSPGGAQTATGGTASASSIYGGGYAAANAFDGNSGTFWAASGAAPQWLAYDYGSGNSIDIVEIAITSSPSNGLGEAPATGNLEWSDNGVSYTPVYDWTIVPFTANQQTHTADKVVVSADSVDAPQAHFITVHRQAAESLDTIAGQGMTVYNVPAKRIDSTFAGFNIGYRRVANQMPVTQLKALGVYRGKIDNPKLKSWAYTIDGHDNFILKLGTGNKTLVFDLSTEQWAWWASPADPRWRASTGMNWRSAGQIPFQYGSNVIVGDDSYGVLWVLDPEKGQDDDLLVEGLEHQFDRVATGQMASRARTQEPVYSVYLTASLGDPKGDDTSVTLDYSDDQGHTYVTADAPQQSELGNYAQEFAWRSMGRVRAPGRLFRITDYGAFARIDGMDVNA